ncbi:hypothetical protein [Gimesia sp.]|uniref:hypothetical protein n=1 Tax=Gimesia sp. TaxID=2024833 RepID=UPI0032EBC749
MENWVLPTIQRAKEEGWTFLDLGNSGITELPLELSEVESLKGLNLGEYFWHEQKNSWIGTRYNGSTNNLSEVPIEISKLQNLDTLILTANIQLTNDGLMHLEDLKNLKRLDLQRCDQITDEGLKHLQDLKYLEWLDLSGCNKLTDDGLKYLQNLKNLEYLILRGCNQITYNGLRNQQNLKNLKRLDFMRYDQSINDGLKFIQDLKYLEWLDLRSCFDITDEGLKHLQDLKNLERLDLSGCNKLTDDGLKYLQNLKNLECLDLSGCFHVTDGGLKYLQNLKYLERLNLRGGNRLTDFGLKYLQNLKNLKRLELRDCYQLTDRGLQYLQDLKSLEWLDHSGCYELTDDGLKYLQSLKNLELLDLSECSGVAADGLKYLRNLKNLKCLDLRDCYQLTNDGLKYLQELKNLEFLDLSGCNQLTNDGLKYLLDLKNLKSLYLVGTSISIPSEVLGSKNPQQIFEWLNNEDKQPLQAFKLLLVGMGRVGKTHLRKRLTKDPERTNHNEPETHEIVSIPHEWPTKGDSNFEMLLCDFGGQGLMHHTHRFYLGAEHCFYLLVIRADWPPEKNRLDYWLRTIALHSDAGTKGKSPVLILITQTDRVDLAKQDVKLHKSTGYNDWDPEAILKNYDRLLEDLKRVSAPECKHYGANVVGTIGGLGYDSELSLDDQQFKNQLRERNYDAIQQLKKMISQNITEIPGTSDGYPPNFFNLKKWITEEFKRGVPYFDYKKNNAFRMLCEAESIPENDGKRNSVGVLIDSRTLYLQILRNLGLIYFVGDLPYTQQTFFTEAKQWVFNPKWLNEPVYHRLLWGTEEIHQTGWLTLDQFKSLLSSPRTEGSPTPDQKKQYEEHERNAICQLLATMRVIHYKQDEDGFLIPDLLKSTDHPERVVSGLDNIDAPFTISYEYLPERIFFTFLARQYPHIPVEDRKDNCFRNTIRFWYEHPHDVNKKIEVAAVYEPYADQSYQPRIVFYIGDSDPDVIRDCRRDLEKDLRACYDKEHWNERDKLIQNVNGFESMVPSAAPRVAPPAKRSSDQSNENEICFGDFRYDTETGRIYKNNVFKLQIKRSTLSGILLRACLEEMKKKDYDSLKDGLFKNSINPAKLEKYGYFYSKCNDCIKNRDTRCGKDFKAKVKKTNPVTGKEHEVVKIYDSCEEYYSAHPNKLISVKSSRLNSLNKKLEKLKKDGVEFTIEQLQNENLLEIVLKPTNGLSEKQNIAE